MSETRIHGGIEWFTVGQSDFPADEYCQCARCGSSVEWVDCFNCGGEEESMGSNCVDDLCHGGECIHGDSGYLRCDYCNGKGGWYRCISSREWCLANSMEGRAGIATTAYNENWDD